MLSGNSVHLNDYCEKIYLGFGNFLLQTFKSKAKNNKY